MAELPATSSVFGRDCRYRVVVSTLAAALLLSIPATGFAQIQRIEIVGDAPRNGIFDPTVEYDAATGDGWLAYSAVFGAADPWGPNVETHIAKSEDAGATWTFEAVVNPSMPTSVTIPGEGPTSGFWNYEVASLVNDPDDPGAEWKLFAHRIFRRDSPDATVEQSVPAFSWIVMRTASDPAGPWAAERALFRSAQFPPAPYAPDAIVVEALDASLSGLLVYSEPGAFERDGTLYVSLSGLTLTGPDRILVLASDDHGLSWRYAGTPLVEADAAPLGYLGFDGSAIVEDRGRVFLLATPESPGVLHDGTLAFELASLDPAILVRDMGVPVIHLALPAQPGLPAERRGGQSDYHEGNTSGGLIQPALQVGELPEMFQFSSTGVRLVAATAVPGLGPAGMAIGATVMAVAGLRTSRRRLRQPPALRLRAPRLRRARVRRTRPAAGRPGTSS